MSLSHIQSSPPLTGELIHSFVDLRDFDLHNAVSFPDLYGCKNNAHENSKHARIKEGHNQPVEPWSLVADGYPDQNRAHDKKSYCQGIAENRIANQGDALNQVTDLQFYVAEPASVDFIDLLLVKDLSLFLVQQADAVDHQAVFVVHSQQKKPAGRDHQSGGKHSLNKVYNRILHSLRV